MASGLDEVDDGMNTVVDNIGTVDLVLCVQIGIIAVFNGLHDWTPGVVVVHKISKPGSINDAQSKTHPVLFNVCTNGGNGNSLW